jgi:hypothetical protein
MDPRSAATPEVLAQQLQLGMQIFGETVGARRTLGEIGSVQKQLADIQQKIGTQNKELQSRLTEAQSTIDKILSNRVPDPVQAPGLRDAYTGLASALRVVENGDRVAPSQAIAVYQESSRQVKARIAEWDHFKHTQLENLDQQLRQANLPPVRIGH